MTALESVATDPNAVSPAERSVLLERARALAAPLSEQSDAGVGDIVALALAVADQSYAIEVRGVREVLAAAPVARLPWARPPLIGVTGVRGEIILVADARLLLGQPHAHLGGGDGAGPVVVLGVSDQVFGLRVDAVDQIASVVVDELVIPDSPVSVATELVRGVTSTQVVLDVDAVCSLLALAAQQEDTP